MMKVLKYYLLDVFTNNPFGGNPLAVFPEADDISDATMQRIANELNLSETTFIQSAVKSTSDCRVRIFTPQNELPMAGHPTIGTAYSILRNGILTPKEKDFLLFDEGVGQIKVDINEEASGTLRLAMHQPLPTFLSTLDLEVTASMLSLQPTDLADNMPVQIVSCGLPMILVPVQTLEVIQRIKPRVDLIEKQFPESDPQEFFVFTRETTTNETNVHCRFFAPRFGVPEDPATGSAHGPLGSYLHRYEADHPTHFVSEQGIEMGRPSRIHVDISGDGNTITDVVVGGNCVSVGEGQFEISDRD